MNRESTAPRAMVFCLAVLLTAFPCVLAEEPLADPDDHQGAPVTRTRTGEAGDLGMIAERATAKGLEYKRLTPIEEIEWATPNAGYRWLLTQIEAGVADARIMRRHYWLKSRLVPFDREIPADWRRVALKRQLAPRPSASEKGTVLSTYAAEGRWIAIGPTTIPGRVSGLSYVPGRENSLLAAMADGGLWLTEDGGVSWEALTEREATQASGATAADPDDPATLYWATGEGNNSADNYGGIGVMRSSDGGRSWDVSNKFSGNIRCLEVDPANSQRLWACGNSGIYRSDDGGASFTQVGGGLPTNASGTDITFRPGEPETIFVNLWGRGLWRSSDSGANWTQVEGGLPTDLSRNVAAICESDPQVMVVSGGVNSGDLWRSEDGGQSWSQLPDPNACSSICWYANTVAIAADDCETIYTGGVRFYRSRNGGATWSQTGGIHVDHHAILTRPGGEVIVGDDGGVYKSSDFGASFTNLSLGLPTTQYYGACGSDVTPGELMGGTQDRGSHQLREGSGWRPVLGADGGMCAIGGQRLLGEYQNTNLRRSINGGNSFHDANSGISSDDPKSWVGVIEKDPADPQTLYVGTHRVYRSSDFHDTPWDSISAPLHFSRQVTALAVSPFDRDVLWAGFQAGGLYRTLGALSANPQWDNVKGTLPTATSPGSFPIRRTPISPGWSSPASTTPM